MAGAHAKEKSQFVWFVGETVSNPHGYANGAHSPLRLVLILSTHGDDFKGASEEEYRLNILEGLETEVSTLKVKHGKFECVGVMHEQDPHSCEVRTHQQHYVPQINAIPVGAKSAGPRRGTG